MEITYRAVHAPQKGIGDWVIEVSEDGVVQQGQIGSHYETEAEAQRWIDHLIAQNKTEKPANDR